MSLDLEKVRQDTPGCQKVLHFNNAGSSLPTRQVLEAVTGHLQLEANIGGYEAAGQANDAIEETYRAAARLLNAQPDEIALIENATRAWDMAFYSIPFKPGDRILTSMAEYGSNFIAFLQVGQRTGAVIDVIPSDESGQVSVEALRDMLDEHVKLIAITHVPTNGGLVNPAAEIGRVAREAGVLYLLDACQSAGQMPLDVAEIGCDFLTTTGRKYLRGPRGTGFLYVNREVLERLEPPFLDLFAATWVAPDRYVMRPDARRFENFESYVAGRVGLGAAINYALELGLDTTYERIKSLAASLRSRLNDIPGIVVRDIGREKCGIVTFEVEGREAAAIQKTLREQQINVSVSIPTSTLLDMQARQIPSLVRASVHYYNSAVEIERFCMALADVLARQN